jgi:hypothetical protein
MAFDWAQYLELAKWLLDHRAEPHVEASPRTAVSRAYYAAFCLSRNYARDRRGFIPTDETGDHSALRRHFSGSRLRWVALTLDGLRQWRNACDYRDDATDLPSVAAQAVARATRIADALK